MSDQRSASLPGRRRGPLRKLSDMTWSMLGVSTTTYSRSSSASSRRSAPAISAIQTKGDPILRLPYDCYVTVFQSLDFEQIGDLEKVSVLWEVMLRDWMIAEGRMYLPELFRPVYDDGESLSKNEKWRLARPAYELYAGRNRAIAGNATCARRYIPVGPLAVNGDYAFFREEDDVVYWQDLRFRRDGTVQPMQPAADVERLTFMVYDTGVNQLGDAYCFYVENPHYKDENGDRPFWGKESSKYHERNVRNMVSLPDSSKHWCHRSDITSSRLFAVGRNCIYLKDRFEVDDTLIARDIATGEMLYRKVYPSNVDRPKELTLVPLRGGGEAVVDLLITQTAGGPRVTEGIRIFDGTTGNDIQEIKTPVGLDGSRIVPHRMLEGQFAIISQWCILRRWVLIEKFAYSDNDQIFHSISKEIVDMGPHPDTVSQVEIDPYSYVAAVLSDDNPGIPQMMSLESTTNPHDDRMYLPHILGPEGVISAWFIPGPKSDLTLPSTDARDATRRPFQPQQLEFPADHTEFEFIGVNRLLYSRIYLERRHCILDFGPRKMVDLETNDLVDEMTHETRC